MSDATRIPAIIRPAVGGAIASVAIVDYQPIRHEQFTEAHVSDRPALVGALNRLVRIVKDATRSHRASPLGRPHIFEDVECEASGKVKLQHNFGRRVFWSVVRWSSRVAPATATTAAPVLVGDENDGASALTDANTLYLKSAVAGLASIAVY